MEKESVMNSLKESELIINPDGSIFHLCMLPEQVADTVILVGDPGRVKLVGNFLREVEYHASNREFVSLSGFFGSTRITALSTGIGTDNTDIVVNELDALVNVDFSSCTIKEEKKKLRLIRIGTSGSIQPGLPPGKRVASLWSIGLDGLMYYYKRPEDPERERLEESFLAAVDWPGSLPRPYASRCGKDLAALFTPGCTPAITLSAHGFYGPQGRSIRAELSQPDLNGRFREFTFNGINLSNYEMESSALYGLSEILGHEAFTVCMILANRSTGEFMVDYKPAMEEFIYYVLETIAD